MKIESKTFRKDLNSKEIELSSYVRDLICSCCPDANEVVSHGYLSFSPTMKPSERIFYIAPMQDYVNLGFMFGSELNTESDLIEGTGKRMRHIKVRNSEHEVELKKLITEAWKNRDKDLHSFKNRFKSSD